MTAIFSESVHRQLASYTLAASAAGVGITAMPLSAEARVVYTHVHHVIHQNGSFGIDLNHDGVSELILSNSHFQRGVASVNLILATPSFGESVAVETIGSFPSSFRLDAALKRGTRVGTHEPFAEARGLLVGQCSHGTSVSSPPCYGFAYNRVGVWGNVKNRYLGLNFTLHGKLHYGWVRLSVEVSRSPVKASATVTGYAYETIPNKAIITGKTKRVDVVTSQPASLGHLAAGASAIPAWRVNRTAATTH